MLLPLSACFFQTVSMRVEACPLTALQDISFSSGAPKTIDDIQRWRFSGNEKIILTCRYTDGFTRHQLLPDSVRSCTLTRSEDGKITDFKCQGRI